MAPKRRIVERTIDRSSDAPTDSAIAEPVPEPVDGGPVSEPGPAHREATIPPPLPNARPKLAIVARNTSSDVANAKAASEPGEPRDPRVPTKPKSRPPRDRARDVSTGVIIPGLPLPPPTDFDKPNIRLRRDESVVAQAAFSNKPLDRVQDFAHDAKGALARFGSRAADAVGQGGLKAVKRFQSLPRKKQLLWVAAPYGIVLVLVLILLQVRDPGRTTPAIVPPNPTSATQPLQALQPPRPAPAPSAALAIAAPQPAPSPPSAPSVPPVKQEPTVLAKMALASGPATPLSKLLERSEHPTTATAVSGESAPADRKSARGYWRTIPIASSLRVKPDSAALRAAKLKANSKLIVFPDFPAREGWILAQRTSGEVGFLPVLHLEGMKDPRFDKDEPNKRLRARRGAKSQRLSSLRRSRSRSEPRI